MYLWVLALATAADFESKIGWWNIFQVDNACVMAAEYEGGTSVMISHEWRTDRIVVMLSDDNWTSLANRNGESVRADFKLSGRHVEYDQWWDESATVVGIAETKNYSIVAAWDGQKHGEDFWPAWALADGVEIKADGKNLGRFSLKDSYEASLALHRCSANALKNDQSDPFAK